MNFPRNSFLLLLRNEFRLHLRSIKGVSVLFLIISQVLLHLVALSLAWGISHSPAPASPASGLYMLSGGLIGMFMLMTSRALANAVQTLYTRGDFDLLLSSPVDRRSVIGVRMGAIALAVAVEVALLVFPFANMFVLFGSFAWAKAYLLVPAMAMLATSIGLAVTLLSFRTLGPRRTRIVVQVFAVLMGMGIMLVIYVPRMMSSEPGFGRGQMPMTAGVEMLMRNSGGYRELLLAPAHWVAQGFLPTVVFLAATAGLLALVIRLTGNSIVAALTTVTGGGRTRQRKSGASASQFHRSFRAIIVLKELRLIMRDPFIIAQILQHSLAALPAAFALWHARIAGMPMSWAALIVLAAGLAAPLAWLTITAEDAPDLLASAPVSRAALMRAKIEAALLPVLPICLAPLLLLVRTHPWFGFSMSFAATGGALSAALINMSNPVARRRDSFKTRHKGSGGRGLLEVISLLFWLSVGVGLAWAGNRFAGWR